jgi:hypothetical protein
MKTDDINKILRYINYRIHYLMHCTKEHQLSVELRERMLEASVAIIRALNKPPYEEIPLNE